MIYNSFLPARRSGFTRRMPEERRSFMRDIGKFSIVISSSPAYNERRAAEILKEAARLSCGALLRIKPDSEPEEGPELVVGRTSREEGRGKISEYTGARDPGRLWEYIIMSSGDSIFITGLGVADPPKPYESAYRIMQDGHIGTVFGAWRFAEEFLGYDPAFAPFDGFTVRGGASVPDSVGIVHTRESLAAQLPAPAEGPVMWSVPTCTELNLNMSCFIIKTAGGKLAVIDGGRPGDAGHIVRCLEAAAYPDRPVVDVWLFSHLHVDHYGVPVNIARDPELASRIEVRRFYHHLLSEEFYTKTSREASPGASVPYGILSDFGKYTGAEVVTVERGDEIKLDELTFRVIRVPSETTELSPLMNMNDSSVVYRLDIGGKHAALFLGDSEWIASGELLKHPEELRADFVQVGHHGCGNVEFAVYRAVAPRSAIFQISSRFWYGDNGEGMNTHNTGVIRSRFFLKQLGLKTEDILTDRYGIVTIPLPRPDGE